MGVEIIHIYDQPEEQWGQVIVIGNLSINSIEEDPTNIRKDVEKRIEKRIPDTKEEDPFDNPLMWKKSS